MFLLKKLITALSSVDNERRQSIDSIETFAYVTSKDLASEKEEIKCNNIIKQYKKWLTLMMLKIQFELPQILDYSYRKLTSWDSGSKKMNLLFNLINHQPDIDKFFYMLKTLMKQNINF